MQYRRAFLLLPLALFLLQCRTAAPAAQPVRLVALTRSDDGKSVDVPLERRRNGTAFMDQHFDGFVSTTTTNFEVIVHRKRDTGPWSIYWDRGVYTDASGTLHKSMVLRYDWDGTPLRESPQYRRYWIAPSDFASNIRPVKVIYGEQVNEALVAPFLEDVPPNGRVQLQLPMVLDGERITYTFTFERS